MTNKAKCYYCGKEATSREHIPPQSFFPSNQKLDLVTIPSCEEHNSKKSNKDEYVRNYITIHRSVKKSGYEKFEEKSRKAFKRNKSLALSVENAEKATLDGEETGIFLVKKANFDEFFDHLASGIFYFLTNKIFNGKWIIHPISFYEDRELYEKNVPNVEKIINSYKNIIKNTNLKKIPEFKNEKVFIPQYYKEENNEKISIFLNLTFYEGFIVFILGEYDKKDPK
ncbi:hypothetical protein EHQ24_06680 [Leptospira noumeaensis]|uniref:HNH endonuclease n=1 Tax=Leptospira noumeaensis TaxID=2484964 RepID=A0A4R9IBW5_9LEPT|nr:hypothetical protein [Leptospira noumeaensis]TGK83283.1 hypothetical protein EHQ24_06680 [Leptospira noumeaensis]